VTLPRSTIRRRRRGASVVRWLIRLAVVAVVFALGVAVGQALEDRPPASEPVTSVTTIQPWTQTVAPPGTITGTTTAP
jgi:hypothetical protein